ncbi:MAG: MmcQ/YjbR family DNA-binding protein [Adhaeribacter sp.]
MTIEVIQNICKQLKGVTEDIKWEDHLCFNIGGKMFLVTTPDSTPATASFKVPDEIFEEVAAKEGFSPAPYLARYKWVYVDNINRLNSQEWEAYIRQSYNLIFAKLPAKVRKEISMTS